MGAGGGPAGVPHDHEGVGEAHRVARRHAEARLEAAARFERGNRDGRHLRPDEGRARRSGMSRQRLVLGAALAAACASRSGGAATASAPVPPAATAPSPPAPGDQPAARRFDAVRYGPSALRYLVHRRGPTGRGAALAAACASRSGGAATASAPVPPAETAPSPPAPGDQPAARRFDAVRYGPSALRYLVHRRVHIEQALGGQTQVQDLGVRVYVAATISGPADSVGYPATFTVDSMVADSGAPLPPPIADTG